MKIWGFVRYSGTVSVPKTPGHLAVAVLWKGAKLAKQHRRACVNVLRIFKLHLHGTLSGSDSAFVT